jgi:hypothetical protein
MEESIKIKKRRWTREEVDDLRKSLFAGESIESISNRLGRKENQVRLKTYFVSDNIDRYWNDSDSEYLKNNLLKSDKEIANELKKTVGTVSYNRVKLNIPKINKWTKEEEESISDLSVPIKDLAVRLNRSAGSIYMRRVKLNITKKSKRGREWYNGKRILDKLVSKYGVKLLYSVEEIRGIV